MKKSNRVNTIEVCLVPSLFSNYKLESKIVVVVDIFRATTIITTMFHNGLEKLIPVKDLFEAEKYKNKGYLVAAERDGVKVGFADFDNHPCSFTLGKVKGKTIVYSTTNGTNTISIAKKAESILIASFLNLSSITKYLMDQKRDIIILCSGWKSNYCIEDSLFAGALSNNLIKSKIFETNCDSTKSSIDLWKFASTNIFDYIKKIFQYKRLEELGLKEVIDYCFTFDITDVIPIIKDYYLVKFKK